MPIDNPPPSDPNRSETRKGLIPGTLEGDPRPIDPYSGVRIGDLEPSPPVEPEQAPMPEVIDEAHPDPDVVDDTEPEPEPELDDAGVAPKAPVVSKGRTRK